MSDWEVTVRTNSGYIKKIRVNDCYSYNDVRDATKGMTGSDDILGMSPKQYDDNKPSPSSNSSNSDSSPEVDIAGFFVIIFLLIFIAAWKYILLFGLIGVSVWYFFFRNKY